MRNKLFNSTSYFPVSLMMIGMLMLFISCGNKQELNDKNKKLEDLFNYDYENGLFNRAVLVANDKMKFKNRLKT